MSTILSNSEDTLSNSQVVVSSGKRMAFLILVISLCITAFLAWSLSYEIDELARGTGRVKASARTQVVQSFDRGVLKELYVREGDSVEKGDVLIQLEDVGAKAAYTDSLNKVVALEITLKRLQAEVYGHQFELPSEFLKWPEFLKNQKDLYTRRKKALFDSTSNLKETLNLIRKEISIALPLEKQGDVGATEILRLQRQATEIEGQIINSKNKYFQEAQTEMAKVEEELAAQKQLMNERRLRLEQTRLIAPADGIVSNISIVTIGATVQSGDVLLELLPTNSELIIEANIRPADFAAIRIGLQAEVKLDAYDPSIYGGLDGEVIYVSPDSHVEESAGYGDQTFYKIHVRILRSQIINAESTDPVEINPGMTALIEIRTRKRTLFNFLSKPITKTIQGALGER